mmetsp:Transcript_12694/g.30216  ORF Transcript_12694/g.30216 Transcript_12694/m.30216 type:complete len:629 (+) Transcript_12694:74-1960(+)|eukprot:CAMPEP_0181441598 /NCGR_PEP_ID=MMETSP1110-20121109/23592_1 /TAXON_ID=174948 /ORGANISM="Symbiodinium sp., Strain CCMP421" /LENGTH=628 /DNA_ID=CAMNT_0023565491 /DNA_START=74 /DNA_END=1960 /DNA_ORIENTATION=+
MLSAASMLRTTPLFFLLGSWPCWSARFASMDSTQFGPYPLYDDSSSDGSVSSGSGSDAGFRRPFHVMQKVAIIGGGPGGVHMASRLKQLGYKHVTVLERTDRVGGKSLTLYRNKEGSCVQEKDEETDAIDTKSCVAFEMGTCFLHNGYHTIYDLVDEYSLPKTVAPEGRAMFSHFTDHLHALPMDKFVSKSILEAIDEGKIKVPIWAITEDWKVMYSLLHAVNKYNKMHKEIFGDIEFSMPAPLSDENLQRINMTFLTYLESNELHALAGFLMFAHAAQGYGYVKTIPAFYGLWWISPELLNGYVQMSFREKLEKYLNPECKFYQYVRGLWVDAVVTLAVGGHADPVKRTTHMLPEGYQKIWTTMAEHDAIDVRFGVQIKSIDRQLHDELAPVIIKYTQDSSEVIEEEYDFLIYSGPHAQAHKYVKDLVEKETSIFNRLESFVLATTLYTSSPVLDYSDETHAPIMYSADKMSGPEQDGSWYADRDDPAIFAGEWDEDKQTRVGYQFFENFCDADPVLCDTDRYPDRNFEMTKAPKVLKRFSEEMKKQNVTNVKVLGQYPWPYFHHFPQTAINEKIPWKLFEMQGERKTWWIGASACFESVHDVTNYNLMLLKHYLRADVEKGKVSFA